MKLKKKLLGLLAAFLTSTSFAAPLLSEGFDDIGTLSGSGWVQTNNSTAGGLTGWFQGNDSVFPAAAGASNSYIAANFNNAPFGGAISNWLITPELALANGQTLNFMLRLLGDGFIDRVEVYLSTSGSSTNVGSTTSSIGDFSMLAAFESAVDTDWAAESLTLSGLVLPVSGRFAFRYVVGDTGIDGNYIGIDSVSVEAPNGVPEPASLLLLGLAFGVLGVSRRRTRAALN